MLVYKLHKMLFVLLLLFICLFVYQLSISESNIKQTATLLKIKGAIGPATQDFIHRGFKKAVKDRAGVIILQMDTPGGLSKSMRLIIQDILNSPIPVISYVAPSGARAASAGTYILYASHVAAMAPGTNIGAATPVSITAPTGGPGKKPDDKNKKKAEKKPNASELKALNDARAYIRSLAQLRKRNVQWAEKAVTHAESLSAEEALKLNVINYIAKNYKSLLDKANGLTVEVRGQSQILKTQGLAIQEIFPDWRTKFLAVITDPSVAYILLMIGVYGLFFEFANPGFIVPGVVGAIALIIALYAFQLLPINYAGLGLILLGLAFIVAEAFVPSFGALGIGGVISFVVGSILLLKTEFISYTLPMHLIIIVTLVTALFFFVVLNMALRSRHRPVVSGREAVLGKHGMLEVDGTHMWVRIEGERWQCRSNGALASGQMVEVVGRDGMILKVKSVSEH